MSSYESKRHYFTHHCYSLRFNIGRNNLQLLLCILLVGDIVINTGPVITNPDVLRSLSLKVLAVSTNMTSMCWLSSTDFNLKDIRGPVYMSLYAFHLGQIISTVLWHVDHDGQHGNAARTPIRGKPSETDHTQKRRFRHSAIYQTIKTLAILAAYLRAFFASVNIV